LKKGRITENLLFPTVMSSDDYVMAYQQEYIKQRTEQKKKEGLSPEDALESAKEELNKEARRIVGKQEYIVPMLRKPIENDMPYGTNRIQLAAQIFMNDLTNKISSDITQIYWLQYHKQAMMYGENPYTFNMMKKWFVANGAMFSALTKLSPIEKAVKGQFLLYYIDKTVKLRDPVDPSNAKVYERIIKYPQTAKVISVDNAGKTITLKNGLKEVTIPFNEIGAYDDRNEFKQGQVEIYVESKKNKESSLQKKYADLVEMDIVAMRGYLGAPKSRMRNVVGWVSTIVGKDIRNLKYVPDLYSAAKVTKEIKNIINAKKQEFPDIQVLYDQAKASVSQFGRRSLLDIYAGLDSTEINPYNIFGGLEGGISGERKKFKIFKNLKQNTAVRTEIQKKIESFHSKMLSETDPNIKKQYINEINKLRDYRNYVKDQNPEGSADFKQIYSLIKEAVDKSNLSLLLNISEKEADTMFKEYYKELFGSKRLNWVNKDEAKLRMLSFDIAFIRSLKRHGDLQKALLDAKQAVKVDNQLYDRTNRIIGSSEGWGRANNALRTFTFGTTVNFMREVSNLKNDILAKGLIKEFAGIFNLKEDNPARNILNLLSFNILLYNLGQLIPGLIFIGNPFVMTMIQMVDIIASSFDDDDEDKPNKLDLFYLIATLAQLRGGVGKTFWAMPLVYFAMDIGEDGDTLIEQAWNKVLQPLVAPVYRDWASLFKMMGEFYDAELGSAFSTLWRMGTGFGIYQKNNDLAYDHFLKGTQLDDYIYYLLNPFWIPSTSERLSSSPIDREVKKKLSDMLSNTPEEKVEKKMTKAERLQQKKDLFLKEIPVLKGFYK